MSTAERIRKLGFQRWYERTLLESHAYLVTAFLGMIATFAAIELIGERRGPWPLLLGIGTAIIGVGLVALGLFRYHQAWMKAETLGGSATCAQCGAYGIFSVLASGSTVGPGADTAWLKVKCRRCGNEWTM